MSRSCAKFFSFAFRGSFNIRLRIKESDLLLYNFDQFERVLNSYLGDPDAGRHVQILKTVSEIGVKRDPAFCLGPPLSRKPWCAV